jgi:glycosyltransferase involved in cell wall biosynthesis
MGLRLLMVSDNYPPFLGGAHRQTRLLAHELMQRGHAVSVATVWHGGLPEYENDEGVGVYRLKQLGTWLPGSVTDTAQRHQPPWPDPIGVWGLRRLIDDLDPEVVHAYGWFSYSAAVALLGKNIPLLISARDYAYACAKRTLLWHGQPCSGPELGKCLECAAGLYGKPKGWAAVLGVFLCKPLLRHKVTGLHSVSTYVQTMTHRDFINEGAGSKKLTADAVIPSFQQNADLATGRVITAKEAAELEPYVKQLPMTPFILFVGALRLVKGLKPLVEAYEQLNTTVPLVLVGTVEADTPKTFPPGVVVAQNFPHKAVLAAWDRCLFGVLPSLWPEPLGSVVYEGMSRGKAVIGTTPGGHTDIIVQGETGLLVPTGDMPALKDAMQLLLTNAEMRERFGQAGLVRAKLFTAEVAVPRFEQVYRQLATQTQAEWLEETQPTIRLRQG